VKTSRRRRLDALRIVLASVAVLAGRRGAGADDATPVPTPDQRPRLGAPTLRAQAIGPVQVRLTADTVPGERVYSVWATRTDAQGVSSRVYFTEGRSYEGSHWAVTDGAAPDATYRYRAYAESGTTATLRDSELSNEVTVHTPPPPSDPPAAPTHLTARPAGPFRVELQWRDRSNDEYGFEIRKQVGDEWVRVLLVDPNVTRVTLHGRPPASEARYRVRAFNVRGVSTDSNAAMVRTDRLVDAPPLLPEPEPRPTPGPCSTREQVMRDLRADGAAESGGVVPDKPLYESKLGGAWGLVEFAYPPLCGNANCSWIIYGDDHGCFRQLGYAGGVGQELVGSTPSGLPVIIDIGHGSASYSSATLMQLVNGWFSPVDSYAHCTHSDEDLTHLTPPFSGCQEDDDLWWDPGD
jgi:hypothetical protein